MEIEKYQKLPADLLLTSIAWNTTNPHLSPELRQLFSMNLCRVQDTSQMNLFYSPMHLAPSSVIEIMSKSSCSVILSINLVPILEKWDLLTSKTRSKAQSMYTSIVKLNSKLSASIQVRQQRKGGKHLTSTLRLITPN